MTFNDLSYLVIIVSLTQDMKSDVHRYTKMSITRENIVSQIYSLLKS